MDELGIGELIWIPDPEEVWRQAEVTSASGGECAIRTDTGVVKKLEKGDKYLLRNVDKFTDEGLHLADDLTELVHLHEASLLHELNLRYDIDSIYTYAGPILIAINPFKRLTHLYSEKCMQRYRDTFGVIKEPHVFAVSAHAFRGVCDDLANQTVLISGESGAGKTETTKFVMRYVTSFTPAKKEGDTENVETRILSSNPLLEALGNAKTLRNDNSSRFGKYIQLHFYPKQDRTIRGAHVDTYLLEKVRITDHSEGERNYHVFYYACAAATKEQQYEFPKMIESTEKGTINLAGCSSYDKYTYLTKSSCFELKGADDQEEFEVLVNAMRKCGISFPEISQIFQILVAVLNCGNITFRPNPNDSECTEPTPDEGMAALELTASILQVDPAALQEAFAKKQIKTGMEFVLANLKVPEANESRDAMAKRLYSQLFLYMVQLVNANIDVLENQNKNPPVFVGVLDIFGFECFPSNSLEQLCINFTNEILQSLFNNYVFKLEQELYKKEGLPWDSLDFPDNSAIVSLMTEKGTGIFPILDEECKVPRGSDKGYCSKLWKAHEKHPHFAIDRTKPESFTVVHYAGPVSYDSDGFLAKNKDQLNDKLLEVLRGSKNELVKKIVDIGATEEPAAAAAPRGGQARKKQLTVAIGFHQQLDLLIESIKKTKPSFVRCLKATPKNIPDNFDRQYVTELLKYQGVLEIVKIMRSGFPVRILHDQCFKDYQMLVPRKEGLRVLKHGAAKEKCEAMLDIIGKKSLESDNPANHIKPGEYYVGKTLVLFRQNTFNALRSYMQRVMTQAAIRIGAFVKMRFEKRRYLRKKAGALILQAGVRGMIGRLLYKKRFREFWREKILETFNIWRDRMWFCKLIRRLNRIKWNFKLRKKKRNAAATKIQSFRRMIVARRKYAKTIQDKKDAEEAEKKKKREEKAAAAVAAGATKDVDEALKMEEEKEKQEEKMKAMEQKLELKEAQKKLQNNSQQNTKTQLEEAQAKIAGLLLQIDEKDRKILALQQSNEDLKMTQKHPSNKQGQGTLTPRSFVSGQPLIQKGHSSALRKQKSGFKRLESRVSLSSKVNKGDANRRWLERELDKRKTDILLVGSNEVGKTAMLQDYFKTKTQIMTAGDEAVQHHRFPIYGFHDFNGPLRIRRTAMIRISDATGNPQNEGYVGEWMKRSKCVFCIFKARDPLSFEVAKLYHKKAISSGALAVLVGNQYEEGEWGSEGTYELLVKDVHEYAKENQVLLTMTKKFSEALISMVADTVHMEGNTNGSEARAILKKKDQDDGSMKGQFLMVSYKNPDDEDFDEDSPEGSKIKEIVSIEEMKDKNGITCIAFGDEFAIKNNDASFYYLACGCGNGEILLYQIFRTGDEGADLRLQTEYAVDSVEVDLNPKLLETIAGHQKAITSIFWIKEEHIVTSSLDQFVNIYNIKGEKIFMQQDSAPVTVAIGVPNTDKFIAANEKNVVRLLSMDPDDMPQRVKFDKEIVSLCLDVEGTSVLVGAKIGIMLVLRLRGEKLKFEFQNKFSQNALTSISTFVPENGKDPVVLVNMQDSSIAILGCQYNDKKELTNLTVKQRVTKLVITKQIVTNTFSAFGGGYVVSGSEDNDIYIFSLLDYKNETISGHSAPVLCVACNIHGTLLVSTDTSGILKMWRRRVEA